MTTVHAFAAGLFLGYLAHAYRVAHDPRGFMGRLRAQLQREEGVDVTAEKRAPTPAEG